jgi:hypothetical protein
MGAGQRRFVATSGILVMLAAGCAKEKGEPAAPPATAAATPSVIATATASPSPTRAGNYVAQVNALCSELEPKVVAITQGREPAIDWYPAGRAEIDALYKEFDAAVDAIPVTDADRPADDAMNAFRRMAATADESVAAATATGKQEELAAAWAASVKTFNEAPEVAALQAAGIRCPAR